MEKNGATKWTDRIKNAVVLERVGEGRTDKEKEKKLAGPLDKKELLAEGCYREMVNEKNVRGRRYQMIDNIMINGLYADTKRKAEKWVERRMLSLQ